MHMSDALLSPAVGGTMFGVTAGFLAVASHRVFKREDPASLPVMGMAGAFVFAAQMINFAIPGTGSSGHFGGGLLLGMLLGPWAGLLTMTAVLIVQSLLFADGGLIALGCNIFNIGVLPALGGHFLVRLLGGKGPGMLRFGIAVVAAAVVCLELGALSVALQTTLSGHSSLPFVPFSVVMLGIHLPIGVAEGIGTVAVLAALERVAPDLISGWMTGVPKPVPGKGAVLAILAATAIGLGGIGSWFASRAPDGLEWSTVRVSGHEEIPPVDTELASAMSGIVNMVAPMPDYDFAGGSETEYGEPSPGKSFSGVLGAVVTLCLIALLGLALRITRNLYWSRR